MPKLETPGHRRDYVGRHRAPGRVLYGGELVVHHTPRHSGREIS